jgi:hypothetical protein
VVGGDAKITLAWASNREASLAAYQVYRAATADDAADIRSMQLVHTEAVAAGDPSLRAKEIAWDDTTVQARRAYWYRLVAVTTQAIASQATTAFSGSAYDLTPPTPIAITKASWLQLNGALVIQAFWASQPGLEVRLQRKPNGAPRWATATDWIDSIVATAVDAAVAPHLSYEFRLEARNASGNLSGPGPTVVVQPELG